MTGLNGKLERDIQNDYRITWERPENNKKAAATLEAWAPDTVAEIADIIGFELATKLVLELGGLDNVFLPTGGQTISDSYRLGRCIGHEAALKLAAFFGTRMDIPAAQRFCCQVLRSRGFTATEIAIQRRVTLRTVFNALADGMPVDE